MRNIMNQDSNKFKFKYLERVIINSDNPEFMQIKSKVGTVIGQHSISGHDIQYTIYFTEDEEECWAVPENYLVSTGQFDNENNIYPKE
jgi:hypothetical protein